MEPRGRNWWQLVANEMAVVAVSAAVSVRDRDCAHARLRLQLHPFDLSRYLAIDIAVLEREPLPRPQPRGRGEQHHRAVTGAEPVGERVQLVPGVERPLLGVAALRVLDPELGRVNVEQPPADRPRQHLAERLGCLEVLPRRIVIRQACRSVAP